MKLRPLFHFPLPAGRAAVSSAHSSRARTHSPGAARAKGGGRSSSRINTSSGMSFHPRAQGWTHDDVGARARFLAPWPPPCLIAIVPFRTGALHELGVLKRIAEERAARLKAAGLPHRRSAARPCPGGAGKPRRTDCRHRRISAQSTRRRRRTSISRSAPEAPGTAFEMPAAAPEQPPAPPQRQPGQAATPVAVPVSHPRLWPMARATLRR